MKNPTYNPIGKINDPVPARDQQGRLLWYNETTISLYDGDRKVSFTLGDDTTYALEEYTFMYSTPLPPVEEPYTYKRWFGLVTKEGFRTVNYYKTVYYKAVDITQNGVVTRLLLEEIKE